MPTTRPTFAEIVRRALTHTSEPIERVSQTRSDEYGNLGQPRGRNADDEQSMTLPTNSTTDVLERQDSFHDYDNIGLAIDSVLDMVPPHHLNEMYARLMAYHNTLLAQRALRDAG